VRGLFTRANILARRYGMCSVAVKTVLFKSFFICFMAWNCENIIQLVLLIDYNQVMLGA